MTQNEAAPAGARNGTDAGTDEPSQKGNGDEAPWPECCAAYWHSHSGPSIGSAIPDGEGGGCPPPNRSFKGAEYHANP